MISPIDSRYSNTPEYKELDQYLSEDAVIDSMVMVELAYLRYITKADVPYLKKSIIEEIKEEELSNKHLTKSVVNVMKRHLPEFEDKIHLGLTSSDIEDTALSYRLKRFFEFSFNNKVASLLSELKILSLDNMGLLCNGHTHGQYAVLNTYGVYFSNFYNRINNSLLIQKDSISNFCGKLSGAIGIYSGTSIISNHPINDENEILGVFGLKTDVSATQIVNFEHIYRWLSELNILISIIANLADDIRNLQRSEINELSEGFLDNQVGSSTMASKQNPINSEHIKGLYKISRGLFISLGEAMLSDHQRDLTSSVLLRFIPEYLSVVTFAITRMTNILKNLKFNKVAIEENISKNINKVSEFLYINLSLLGYDGHEIVRKAFIFEDKESKKIINDFLTERFKITIKDLINNKSINNYFVNLNVINKKIYRNLQ